MNYVFCGAYRQLLFALHLKNLGRKVTIITSNESIKEYCNITNINYIYYEAFRVLRPDIKYFFKVVIVLKKRLAALIKKIDFKKEDNFFLLGNVTAYDAFYLAKEFSKKGVVYFKNSGMQLDRYKPKLKDFLKGGSIKYLSWRYVRMLVLKYLLKISLDLNVIFYEQSEIPRFGIDEKFIQDNNIIKILQDRDFNEIIFDVLKKSKIDQKEYENLVIAEGEGMISTTKYDSIKRVYKNLLNLPIEVAYKRHPHPSKEECQIDLLFKELFNNCEEIPDYIPAELYLNNIKKHVISIASSSLITASKLQHLKAVSLLELVDWYNDSYKNVIKDYITKASKNKIIIPISFEELKEVLSRD